METLACGSGTIRHLRRLSLPCQYCQGFDITFTFAGTATGKTISGTLYMGEYLDAKFTAARHQYSEERPAIRIPKGRPIAT